MKPDLDTVLLLVVDLALKGGKFFHVRDQTRTHSNRSSNLIYSNIGTNVRYSLLMVWSEQYPLFDFHHEIDTADAIRLIKKYWHRNRLTSGEWREIVRMSNGDALSGY